MTLMFPLCLALELQLQHLISIHCLNLNVLIRLVFGQVKSFSDTFLNLLEHFFRLSLDVILRRRAFYVFAELFFRRVFLQKTVDIVDLCLLKAL